MKTRKFENRAITVFITGVIALCLSLTLMFTGLGSVRADDTFSGATATTVYEGIVKAVSTDGQVAEKDKISPDNLPVDENGNTIDAKSLNELASGLGLDALTTLKHYLAGIESFAAGGVNENVKYVYLTEDLVYSTYNSAGSSAEFAYGKVFDGNGYKVTLNDHTGSSSWVTANRLTDNVSPAYENAGQCGIFVARNRGVIKNTRFEFPAANTIQWDATVKGYVRIGIIMGENRGLVENIYLLVDGKFYFHKNHNGAWDQNETCGIVGGIAARNGGKILDSTLELNGYMECNSKWTANGDARAIIGGMVGMMQGFEGNPYESELTDSTILGSGQLASYTNKDGGIGSAGWKFRFMGLACGSNSRFTTSPGDSAVHATSGGVRTSADNALYTQSGVGKISGVTVDFQGTFGGSQTTQNGDSNVKTNRTAVIDCGIANNVTLLSNTSASYNSALNFCTCSEHNSSGHGIIYATSNGGTVEVSNDKTNRGHLLIHAKTNKDTANGVIWGINANGTNTLDFTQRQNEYEYDYDRSNASIPLSMDISFGSIGTGVSLSQSSQSTNGKTIAYNGGNFELPSYNFYNGEGNLITSTNSDAFRYVVSLKDADEVSDYYMPGSYLAQIQANNINYADEWAYVDNVGKVAIEKPQDLSTYLYTQTITIGTLTVTEPTNEWHKGYDFDIRLTGDIYLLNVKGELTESLDLIQYSLDGGISEKTWKDVTGATLSVNTSTGVYGRYYCFRGIKNGIVVTEVTAEQNVKIDVDAPEFLDVAYSKPVDLWTTDTISLTFGVNDKLSGVYAVSYTVDSNRTPVVNENGVYSIPLTSNKEYLISVSDHSGNVNSFTVTPCIDKTAPLLTRESATTITDEGGTIDYQSSTLTPYNILFTYTLTYGASGASIAYCVDGGEWKPFEIIGNKAVLDFGENTDPINGSTVTVRLTTGTGLYAESNFYKVYRDASDYEVIVESVTFENNADKIYDGTTDVKNISLKRGNISVYEYTDSGARPVVVPNILEAILAELNVTGTYARANVGENIPISFSVTPKVGFENKYRISVNASAEGNITKKPITVDFKGTFTKTYGDDNPTAKISDYVIDSLIEGDSIDIEVMFKAEKYSNVSIEGSDIVYAVSFINKEYENYIVTWGEDSRLYIQPKLVDISLEGIDGLRYTGEALSVGAYYINAMGIKVDAENEIYLGIDRVFDVMDAGVYTMIVFIEDDNYLMREENLTFEFEVYKANPTITVSDTDRTYNGTPMEVKISLSIIGDCVLSITYDGKSEVPVEAGRYNVDVELEESTNFYGAKTTAVLVINKADYGEVLYLDADYVFDGYEKSIAVNLSTIPVGTEITYSVDGFVSDTDRFAVTDAGTFNVAAKLVNPNYNDLIVTAVLTVRKADMQGITFENVQQKYNGETLYIYAQGVPDDATVVYRMGVEEKNYAKLAGSYDVTVTITKPNYNDVVLQAKIIIDRLKFEGIIFNNKTVTFNGKQQSIIAENLPDFATVSYTANKATKAGSYQATCVVTAENYEMLTLKAKLVIKPKEVTIEFEDMTEGNNYQVKAIYKDGDKIVQEKILTADNGLIVKEDGSYTVDTAKLSAGNYTVSGNVSFEVGGSDFPLIGVICGVVGGVLVIAAAVVVTLVLIKRKRVKID